ncbi:Uma2 family endonuclease [Streptomyces sp. NBC_00343]|uniref:Uma2 family endonuclease n=1 Tax=Streptomyces sp. NBC_00343 TaxID=2975719 RepID=UPI002E2E77BE|nr:Uma2 family endonuclease [Streptomyces sp. NBC_00343]
MTVREDRIAMAEVSGELTLDVMFEWLEKMPIPEGIRVEIVGGNIYMPPQRDTHWEIIRRVVRALEDKFGMQKSPEGYWQHQDVEFVAEVISKGTAANDYGPKKAAYALAEVPVYVIADPHQGRCHVYTHPKGDDYATETKAAFGDDMDLTGTVVGLTLSTADFPRD